MSIRIFRTVASAATTAVALSCASVPRALPTAAPESLGFSPAAIAGLTPVLQAYVDSGKLAGISAVVVRHGQLAYDRQVGWMDLERHVPMKRDAVFRIYSMTKPITAVALMKLVDAGRISLDDPVSKFIPSFAHLKVFAGGSADQPILKDAESPMTIRQVLTHTSGLAYGTTSSPVDTIFLRAKMYDPARTLEQFADSLAKLPLMFSPGTGWNYSSGIDLAGRIVEVAAGKPLDEFFEEAIFQPLGMEHTGFRKKGFLKKHLARLYERGPDGRLREVAADGLQAMYEPDARFFWASGGLLSTVDDYLRFTQMLLNRGEFNGRRILSTQSVDAMTHNQLPAAMTPLKNRPSYERGYGYGLAMSVLVDSTMATLPGPNGIYRWSGYVGTYFWNDPQNDLIGMVWTQFTPGRTYPLEQDFQRLVYGALQR